MYTTQFTIRLGAALLSVAISHTVAADVLELTEKEDWISLVGNFTTIDFTGFEAGTFITDQYIDLGVLFTDGNDNIHHTCSYVNDCWGLAGSPDSHLLFDTHQTYIAADFPGVFQIDLYDGNRLLSTHIFEGGGTGFFLGIISIEPFDAVILSDPIFNEVSIDDLHFGFGIPGDLNHDDIVGVEDLLLVLDDFGSCPEQIDPCPGDINNNNEVGLSDMFLLLDSWGPCNDCDDPDTCPADINNDCLVGTSDLLVILGSFGPCPDANYIICPADITFDGIVNIDDIRLILDNWGE